MICHLEFVLLQEFLLERQETWADKRNNRALDRRTRTHWTVRARIVGGNEFRVMPAYDRRHRHLIGRSIDPDHRLLGHKFLLHLVKLLLELLTGIRLASKAA